MRREVAVALLCLSVAGVAGAAPDPNEAAARRIAQHFARGEIAAVVATFDATMAEKLPAAQVEAVWKGLVDRAGPLQSVGEPWIAGRQGPHTVVRVPLRFRSAPLDLKLAFDGAGRVSGLFFVPPAAPPSGPPPYAKPEAYSEVEVTVGPLALPGTLTLPKGAGPFPAVVLVHGSGPHDRDETIGPNRPFRDLAWGLASRGVAVLRYEKRTKVRPGDFGPGKVFTVREETIDDAVAAAALLRKRPEIDPARVFVLGHSLGGKLAPRIGRADPKLAGLVLVAAAARPLPDLVDEQVAYLIGLDGQVSPEEQARADAMKRDTARIRSGAMAPDELVLGAPGAYWKDLAGYDPVAEAAALDMAILVVHAGRDYQVPMTDFRRWETLRGRPRVELRLFPDLNHLLMAGEGKSRPEEYERPGHVAPQVVDVLAAWMASVRP